MGKTGKKGRKKKAGPPSADKTNIQVMAHEKTAIKRGGNFLPGKESSEDPEVTTEAGQMLVQMAHKGRCEDLCGLLDLGVDVNSLCWGRAASGQRMHSTALISAVFSGQKNMVELLISRGATPTLANSIGSTPLMEAAQGECVSILKMLLQVSSFISQAICRL